MALDTIFETPSCRQNNSKLEKKELILTNRDAFSSNKQHHNT